MLIAEELLLLLLDDDSGKTTNASYLDTGIGGALLVELALGGHVEVVKESGLWARAKVRPTDAPPPADAVLAEALGLVAEKERRAQDLVGRLGRKRREPLLSRLEGAGVLRREEDKVLGLLPRTRWPAVDSTHESEVRRLLGDVLVRGATPDERTAALISLLSALGIAHKVVDGEGVAARDLKRRSKEIAEGDWAAKAVRDAVAAAQAAVAGAATAAGAAAATS